MTMLKDKSANFESKIKAEQQQQRLSDDKKTGCAILTADNCKCKNILIVDDEEFNLEATANILEGMDPGLSFWKVKDGDEAVQLCEEISLSNPCLHCDFFRLIIMDFNMPKLGGIEATKQILDRNKKKIEECGIAQQILVLGCTAYTDDNTKAEGKANGMAHVMYKPYKKMGFVQAFVQIGLLGPEVMDFLAPSRYGEKQKTPPEPIGPSHYGFFKKSPSSTGLISMSPTLKGRDISNVSNISIQDK